MASDQIEKVTYILREVTSLVALAALDALSRARLGTLAGLMTLLLAVLAGMRVDTFLGAIASTMTDLLAINALDGRLCDFALGLFLLAVLQSVSLKYPGLQYDSNLAYLADVAKLAAIATERNTSVLNEAGRRKTLEILCCVLRPALSKLRTARLIGQLNGENELTVRVTHQVDDSHVDRNLLLLGDQVDTQPILSKSLLHGRKVELLHGGASISLETGPKRVQITLLSSINQ